jgi:hydroxymethylglutaryl-CoA synthase
MNKKIGIEAIAHYIPNLYLPIKDLAIARNIDPEKLELGLGLKKMALNDVNEDTATLAANVLLKLIQDFDINPTEIAKITLGTESALDGSKPTAMYATKMVESVLEKKYGERVFRHTDITDTVFACVGGIDALYNSIDFVNSNPEKKAIVLAADYAKYTLASSGEYTQGSGAVAILISSNPKLIQFDKNVGIATDSVFDFFKPKQSISLSKEWKKILQTENEKIEILQDEPVFDGQYSNECYKNRIREAYYHLKKQKNCTIKLFDEWEYLIFHLPYAHQGQRIFMDIFGHENAEWLSQMTGKKNWTELNANDLKAIAASEPYKTFVNKKIRSSQKASSEVGNIYTASIFLALLSALEIAYNNGEELSNKKIGFLSYGSGSKSKCFEGTILPKWKEIIKKQKLFATLEKRKAINFSEYEQIHTRKRQIPLDHSTQKFVLKKIETEIMHLKGARYYGFVE